MTEGSKHDLGGKHCHTVLIIAARAQEGLLCHEATGAQHVSSQALISEQYRNFKCRLSNGHGVELCETATHGCILMVATSIDVQNAT